ncbi:MAG: protease SohB [Gammaproteobacteria bacterium RIFCSPHIGHO2_02_FULL_42_13]|nr:MAG: protease SohB [Gammaproteobacteria bacterium RIFCSPHIGHO2_02_FULL_42_13]OGT70563.1 MAG: protease SohB [Gammaproteobacteria bacterium RIFCSPLOWO2_02_FULL_42_9]
MNTLIQLLLFLGEMIILVVAVLIVVAGIVAIATKEKTKEKNKINVRNLNEYYKNLTNEMSAEILEEKAYKKYKKSEKKSEKRTLLKKQRIFILNFDGDWKASAVNLFREEITAILCVAKPQDEVVVRLESGGGVIHGYGLAASELQRIKDHQIPLTIAVDKVAASGGYMMACVADKILAAPFAIIGSIGVLAQLPNFHRFLKKHDVDFEQITAGQYKRTLSLFGENTSDGRKKFQTEINEAHQLFKQFITKHRPQIDIDKIATGEYWFGQKAKELNLVDNIMTSDEYLISASQQADLFEVSFKRKKKLLEKLGNTTQLSIKDLIASIKQKELDDIFYL